MSAVAEFHCGSCGNEQKHMQVSVQGKVNHVAHAIGSLISGGLWLFVWAFIIINNKKGIGWQCARCGNTK
jgi:hypothetical protein